jgi:hypothetical protein
MNSFVKKLLSPLCFLLGIPISFAASEFGPFSPLIPLLRYMFYFGSLSWLDPAYKGYAVKALFFIVIMTVINTYSAKVITDKRARGVIAFAIAFISVLFMPKDIEIIAGTQYGAIGALVLLGALPAVAIIAGFRTFKTPGSRAMIVGFAYLIFSVIGSFVGFSVTREVANHHLSGLSQTYSLVMAILFVAFIVYLVIWISHNVGLRTGRVSDDFAKALGGQQSAANSLADQMNLARRNFQEDEQVLNLLKNEDREEAKDIHELARNIKLITDDIIQIITKNRKGLFNTRLSPQQIVAVERDLIRRLNSIKPEIAKVYKIEMEKAKIWENAKKKLLAHLQAQNTRETADELRLIQDYEKIITGERSAFNSFETEIAALFSEIGLMFQGKPDTEKLKRLLSGIRACVLTLEEDLEKQEKVLKIIEKYERETAI